MDAAQIAGNDLVFVNTFNLDRRLTWTYQRLQSAGTAASA